ncbi:MAG: acyl-CoA synthetase FdrA [Candidatus Rifleibacteriota bacterium]
MVVQHQIRKQTYFDSVTLMLIGSQIKKLDGIENAVVGMGTDYNIDSLKRLEMYQESFKDLTPNDLIICIKAKDEKSAANGIREVEKLLSSRKKAGGSAQELPPSSFEEAASRLPDSNMVLISVPGEYAAREAEKALNANKHVMLFSDNVTIDQELRLKKIGVEKGLLVMGPDCGTAIINNVPLAFANAVRKGNIGLVAASGTGLQEVTSTIHRLGQGISQAIGVGGRDLSEKIGGLMTIMATRALAKDPETKVIVLISKPPAESVLEKVFDEFKNINKSIVVYFIGADPKVIESHGFVAATNLEDAAIKAAELAGIESLETEYSDSLIGSLAADVTMPAPLLRGLYSGGTLCDEAQRVLQPLIGEIFSNTPIKGCKEMADIYKSTGNCIIDLGDDNFTRGKAHPMIDPGYRTERIVQEFEDKNVGLIMFDVVLGYGSHPDMAGEMVASIKKAREKTGRNPVLAACICGTPEDPQNYQKQKAILEEAGVFVFPTNVAMVKFAARCMERK